MVLFHFFSAHFIINSLQKKVISILWIKRNEYQFWKLLNFDFKYFCSSFSESIPDFSTIISLILWLKWPIVSRVDSNHIRMLVGLLSIQLGLLAHGSWPDILIFRENDINLSWWFFFLWIWSCHNILELIKIYFSINFLILFETFVHSLNDCIVVSRIVALCQRFIF